MTDFSPSGSARNDLPRHDTTSTARPATGLPGFTLSETPRRFAVCEYDEQDSPQLRYWGLQTSAATRAFSADGATSWHATSAERMCEPLSIALDVELLWLDPPGEDQAPR